MNKKYIIILTSTLALASLGFYFYNKRKTQIAYQNSVKELAENYDVFN